MVIHKASTNKAKSKMTPEQIKSSVSYLCLAFSKAQHNAVKKAEKKVLNTKGSTLYDYQVEFCYLIDEIQRGTAIKEKVKKHIEDANSLIAELLEEQF